MSSETDVQWKIFRTLEEISGKLDTLISIIQLGKKNELTLLKEQILGTSKVRRAIYNLCNGENTINEISNRVNQKVPNVSNEISYLVEAGLVIIKKEGVKKYPQKIIL